MASIKIFHIIGKREVASSNPSIGSFEIWRKFHI